jgi:hypothetical protein
MGGFDDFVVHAGIVILVLSVVTPDNIESSAIAAVASAALIEAYWEVLRPDA